VVRCATAHPRGKTVWKAAQRDVRGRTECANPHLTAAAFTRQKSSTRVGCLMLETVRESDPRAWVSLGRWSGWSQAVKGGGSGDDRPAAPDAGGSSLHQRHPCPSNAHNWPDLGTAWDSNERWPAARALCVAECTQRVRTARRLGGGSDGGRLHKAKIRPTLGG
jgi:hypothetical protein